MFTQRFFAPAIQTAGRSIACSTSEVFQSVRNYNHRDHNVTFSDDYLSQNLFGRFTSQFSKTEHGSFIKVVSRNFGSSNFDFIREFSAISNDNTHSILCSLPEYSSTTANIDNVNQAIFAENLDEPLNIQYNQDINLDLLIKKFKSFSHMFNKANIFIDEKTVSFILTSLTRKQNDLSYSQLIDILSSIKLWQAAGLNNKNFDQFLNNLEIYCTHQVKRWTLSQSLLVADYWYIILKGSTNYYYLKRMQRAHVNYLKYFSESQFVQYMFYAHVLKDIGNVNITVVVKKLKEILPMLSIKEIAIISMGIFNSDKKNQYMNASINTQIVQRLIAEKQNVPDELIVPILKCLKRWNVSHTLCLSLFDAFQHIENYNSYVRVHFCQLASARVIYHTEFMTKLAKCFIEDMPSLRLKDLERYVYLFMFFNMRTPANKNIFHLIVEELRKPERIIEINHFPHNFVSCVTHLTSAGVYPLDLISAVFQPSMIQYIKDTQDSCSYSDIFRSVIELSWSLLIEGPSNYIGYQLDSSFRDAITKEYLSKIPNYNMEELTKTEVKMLALRENLNTFLETTSSSIVNTLPQFHCPDLVFCTNSDGEVVQIPEKYFQQCDVHPKWPVCTKADIRWNVVVYQRTSFTIRPHHLSNGNFLHKIRLLEKLGYIVSLAKPIPGNLSVLKRNLYFKDTLCNTNLNMDSKVFTPESLQSVTQIL